MAIINLTQNLTTLVDDEDYLKINQYKWYYSNKGRGRGYAQRNIRRGGKNKILSLHNFIMNPPKGFVTDHINGDTLDNRKENLRVCKPMFNFLNKRKRSDNKSGYIGVHFHKITRKWRAQIKTIRGRTISLGLYNSPEEAAKIRDLKAEELYGKFAKLNF